MTASSSAAAVSSNDTVLSSGNILWLQDLIAITVLRVSEVYLNFSFLLSSAADCCRGHRSPLSVRCFCDHTATALIRTLRKHIHGGAECMHMHCSRRMTDRAVIFLIDGGVLQGTTKEILAKALFNLLSRAETRNAVVNKDTVSMSDTANHAALSWKHTQQHNALRMRAVCSAPWESLMYCAGTRLLYAISEQCETAAKSEIIPFYWCAQMTSPLLGMHDANSVLYAQVFALIQQTKLQSPEINTICVSVIHNLCCELPAYAQQVTTLLIRS